MVRGSSGFVSVSGDNELVCPHCGSNQIFWEEKWSRRGSVAMATGGDRAVITAGAMEYRVAFWCENCQEDVAFPEGMLPSESTR